MPFGPTNVIWHSSPGACTWQFANIIGGAYSPTTETMPVPVLAGAGPHTALFILISQPGAVGPLGGVNSQGSFNVVYIDAASVVHMPTIEFEGNDGFARLIGFADVGTAGGSITFQVGTNWLNFISGDIVSSANGVAVACAVDLGIGGVVLAYAGPGTDGTLLSAVAFEQSGSSASPSVTAADILGRGVLIGAATSISSGSIAGSGSAGWSDVVSDFIAGSVGAGSLAGVGSDVIPPSSAALSAYDTSTLPADLTCTWTSASSGAWKTTAGALWLPPAASGGGQSQIIG